MNETPQRVPAEVTNAVDLFPSLSSLRAAHSRLLKRHSEIGEPPELLDELQAFIRRGRATGLLLDEEDDRWASQGLLDYWVAVLYRAGREPPDATLADFDPEFAQEQELEDEDCPYVGLDAFSEDKHPVFFGRQRVVEGLIGRLKEGHLLAVVGPSGSGKSSLILAGLLPALKAGAVPGSEEWRYYPAIVPGSNPLASLARLFSPTGTAGWIPRQVARLQKDAGHLAHLIRLRDDRPTVLVIDQFEEVFTLCEDARMRRAFTDNLLGLIQAAPARHVVILTMRSDFEPHVTALPEFQEFFESALMRVPPLSAAELREAIVKPAESVGLKFEEGVVDALLQDILGEPTALPLLQFTLLKLWDRREHNRITWEAYQRLGGGRQALANVADEFYAGLMYEEKVTARYIFLRMVRPGDGLEATSNRIRRTSLYQAGPASYLVDAVLGKLLEARLVRLTAGDTPDDDQVEVAHEALLRNWPQLVDWLREEQAAMTTRRQLEARAAEWVRLGRGQSGLLDEVEVLEAQRWLASAEATALGYDEILPKFVEASRAQHAREAKARTRRMRLTVGGLALGLLVFIVLASVALWQWNNALWQRNNALCQANLASSRELATNAISLLAIDPQLSLRLAVEAVSRTCPADGATSKEAEDALHRAMRPTLTRLTLSGHTGLVYGVAFSPDGARLATASADKTAKVWDAASGQEVFTLTGHTGAVRDIAFGSDGKRLATASEDGTAKVWDAESGQEVRTLRGHTGLVHGVAFSPDGAHLATAGEDGTAKVWDAETGKELYTLKGHTGVVYGVVFSPRGTRLATASADGTAKVWETETGKELRTLSGHAGLVYGVAFSPDGVRLATAGEDGTAKVWDVETGEQMLSLKGQTGVFYGIAFSPDGRRLATAGEDGTARVWDAASGWELPRLAGHTAAVRDVIFRPDGARLATASTDGTARVWEPTPTDVVFALVGHAHWVDDIAFSPDGRRLATASEDGTAKVWDAETGQELHTLSGHTHAVDGIAFSPDGARVATASADKTVKVWETETGMELLTLSGHTGLVYGVAFSPDGAHLAAAGEDGTAVVWETDTGEQVLTLSGHTYGVYGVTFSPDGARLATASADKTVKVWETETGKELLTLSGHTSLVYGVAFSPDGAHLATASADGTAKVWDAASGSELFSLKGHDRAVQDIAFSPDGKRLATASTDGTAKVWDAASGREVFTLTGHTGAVLGIAFRPDGKRLATASVDKTVNVYALDIEELKALARQRPTRPWTDEECRKYLHVTPCPSEP